MSEQTILTKSNIKDNLIIEMIEHHEWGPFRVLTQYDRNVWEIRGRSGDRILTNNEFKFWRIKNER